ncbi:MAG: hypothetical protein V4590_02935 [Bacteroidota bacterium]
MNITEILEKLDARKSAGFQLRKRNGFLTSTWLIYKRKGFYYYFDIAQRVEFVDAYKYTKVELIDLFDGHWFEIDLGVG